MPETESTPRCYGPAEVNRPHQGGLSEAEHDALLRAWPWPKEAATTTSGFADVEDAVARIVATRVREAEQRGAEQALRDAAGDVFDTALPADCARYLEARADAIGGVS